MTKKIPAWSAQLTANGPKDWRTELGRKALELGISSGELMRQLLMIGAKVKFPAMAKKLMDSHRRYYPSRCLSMTTRLQTATIMAMAIGFLASGLGLGGGHDLRRSRMAHRPASVRNVRWQGAASA